MSVDGENRRLGTIREASRSYIENSVVIRQPNNSSNSNSSLVCDCQPSVLIVDDTEFNIIPVERMLKNHFNIDAEKASNG